MSVVVDLDRTRPHRSKWRVVKGRIRGDWIALSPTCPGNCTCAAKPTWAEAIAHAIEQLRSQR